ncbi:hypothetical protein ACP3V3_02860 [Vibrio sp. PNB22_3_1]
MSGNKKVPFFKYIQFMIEKVNSGDLEVSQINPHTLIELGGARERRENAVKQFKAVFVDEDGQLIPSPPEVEEWVDDMSTRLMEVRMLAMGSARFETTRLLEESRAKLKDTKDKLVTASESLAETVGVLDETRAEADRLAALLGESNQEKAELASNITQLEADKAQLLRDISAKDERITLHVDQIEELRAAAKERASEMQSLEEDVATWSQRFDTEYKKSERLERDKEQLAVKVEELGKDSALLKENLASEKNAREREVSRYESEQARLTQLAESARSENNDLLAELDSAKQGFDEQVNTLSTRNQELEQAIALGKERESGLSRELEVALSQLSLLSDLVKGKVEGGVNEDLTG